MVQEDLLKYITNGDTIIPNEEDFDGTCSLEWIEDVGFNLQQAISGGYIVGVREGSKAFEAGLEDGQGFMNCQYVDQLISVCIVDQNGKTREITYSKESTIRIPQYKYLCRFFCQESV